MPNMSALNGLIIEPIPEEFNLSDFEMQLIAKDLLFMKIFKLPKSRMPATKDKIINVPLTNSDIQRTANLLPRSLDESSLVNVQLKRTKDLKNVHSQALVRPEKLIEALRFLQSNGNPFYDFSDVGERKKVENDNDETAGFEKDNCLDTCLIP